MSLLTRSTTYSAVLILLGWFLGPLSLYYKQGTTPADLREVAVWTRELIDAAIKEGGAHYLPYQIVATPKQFRAAYPNADGLFALKRRVDPTNKFRNRLWDAYYRQENQLVATLHMGDHPVNGIT